ISTPIILFFIFFFPYPLNSLFSFLKIRIACLYSFTVIHVVLYNSVISSSIKFKSAVRAPMYTKIPKRLSNWRTSYVVSILSPIYIIPNSHPNRNCFPKGPLSHDGLKIFFYNKHKRSILFIDSITFYSKGRIIMINRLMSYTIFIFLICSIIIFLAIYKKTAPTITFFPLDSDTQFEYSDTDLLFSHDKGKKKYQLQWNVHSKSDRNLYLRQDVSLLFANGKLKGVKSKWEEDSAVIEIDETLQSEKEVLWETISFH